MADLPPPGPEIGGDAFQSMQNNCTVRQRPVFVSAAVARLAKRSGFQNDQSMVAVHVPMLGPMFRSDVRGDGDLERTAVVMMNPMTGRVRMLVVG
jgi:hypothetical protein